MLYGSPAALGYLSSKVSGEAHPRTKQVLVFIQRHIGNVCRVAVIVSAVANIRNGKVVSGCAALACLIAGYACQREWVSRSYAEKFDYACIIIGCIAGYETASPLLVITSILIIL